MERLKEVLKVKKECGISFGDNERTLSCYGKVNVENRNGCHMLGYVIDENRLSFKIPLESNDGVWLVLIKWSNATKYFLYQHNMNHNQRSITQCWPM